MRESILLRKLGSPAAPDQVDLEALEELVHASNVMRVRPIRSTGAEDAGCDNVEMDSSEELNSSISSEEDAGSFEVSSVEEESESEFSEVVPVVARVRRSFNDIKRFQGDKHVAPPSEDFNDSEPQNRRKTRFRGRKRVEVSFLQPSEEDEDDPTPIRKRKWE